MFLHSLLLLWFYVLRTCFTSLSTMSLMVAVIISGDDMDAFILFKKRFF